MLYFLVLPSSTYSVFQCPVSLLFRTEKEAWRPRASSNTQNCCIVERKHFFVASPTKDKAKLTRRHPSLPFPPTQSPFKHSLFSRSVALNQAGILIIIIVLPMQGRGWPPGHQRYICPQEAIPVTLYTTRGFYIHVKGEATVPYSPPVWDKALSVPTYQHYWRCMFSHTPSPPLPPCLPPSIVFQELPDATIK